MGSLGLVFHAINFAAPALGVALLMTTVGRFMGPRVVWPARWWQQTLLHFAAGLAVLVAGLLYFGVDGKMMTYLGLVVASASTQWLLVRGWKR